MYENRIKLKIDKERFSEGEIKEIKSKISKWKKEGYSCLTIMHFLARSYAVSGITEGNDFIIKIL